MLSVSKELRRSALVKSNELLAKCNVSICLHQHLEEVEFAHVAHFVTCSSSCRFTAANKLDVIASGLQSVATIRLSGHAARVSI